jgi:hypothetical protein
LEFEGGLQLTANLVRPGRDVLSSPTCGIASSHINARPGRSVLSPYHKTRAARTQPYGPLVGLAGSRCLGAAPAALSPPRRGRNGLADKAGENCVCVLSDDETK